jgi:hypothetical protein
MTPDEAMASTKATCPDCGSGFSDRPYNRRGWFYAECGRRYHVGRGKWEPMAPTGCLSRQLSRLRSDLAAARGVIERLPKDADDSRIAPGMSVVIYSDIGAPVRCVVNSVRAKGSGFELRCVDEDGKSYEVDGWEVQAEQAEQAAKAGRGA